jgi:hypothetical protein
LWLTFDEGKKEGGLKGGERDEVTLLLSLMFI